MPRISYRKQMRKRRNRQRRYFRMIRRASSWWFNPEVQYRYSILAPDQTNPFIIRNPRMKPLLKNGRKP